MRKLLLGIAVIVSACGFIPEKVALSDPEVQALLAARQRVDTATLGFTPIENATNVRLERSKGAYDAMLHIYGDTSRTVSFRAVPGGWRWIGEQEIHSGPKTYDHPDGTFHESITITYHLEPISGFTLNEINIDYAGEDPRLQGPSLTLQDVRAILKEWQGAE